MLVFIASLFLLILESTTNLILFLTIISIMLLGSGEAIILNTGITYISEVIGQHSSGGAFVFGAYSFLDKMSNGIIIFVIMKS